MAKHSKIDSSTLVQRISDEASLKDPEKDTIRTFSRQQLLELFVFITELKRNNLELNNKIEQIQNQKGNVDGSNA